VGVAHPEQAVPILANYVVGLVLHQLSYPDPAFDPEPGLKLLIDSLAASSGRAS